MAKNPLTETNKAAEKLSGLLSDIATKMASIKSTEMVEPFRVPEFDSMNEMIDQMFSTQEQKIKNISAVWKDYGANLQKVIQAEKKGIILRETASKK